MPSDTEGAWSKFRSLENKIKLRCSENRVHYSLAVWLTWRLWSVFFHKFDYSSNLGACNWGHLCSVFFKAQLAHHFMWAVSKLIWTLMGQIILTRMNLKLCHTVYCTVQYVLYQSVVIRYMFFFNILYDDSNKPPFRMEYRNLSKMRDTKKLLWNWNISTFQLLMDCVIYNNMKSWNKQWNTLPRLWNLLISIFHSSMEFHGGLFSIF